MTTTFTHNNYNHGFSNQNKIIKHIRKRANALEALNPINVGGKRYKRAHA